jgi:hypothetical protein
MPLLGPQHREESAVTVDPAQLLVLGLMTAALHWLIARSAISKPLWSRARGWRDGLLRCPACSGWWLGLGLGVAGVRPLVIHDRVASTLASAVLGTILTPIFEAVLLWGLEVSAIDEREKSPPQH